MARPLLSVVTPCFNEEAVLPEFHRRLAAACRDLGETYEIVLVNDGSRDRTWNIMLELARNDPSIVCVNLSRNHGHQLALSAGLSVARGLRVLVLDADLQDPPELLPEMMDRMDDGADVVYGQRRRRAGESWFKLVTASLFYRFINKLSNVKIPVDTGDFRLMSRRVVDTILGMPERTRFMRGMVSWVGHRQDAILYDRDPRFAGETKYPLRKMWTLALDAITSFSTKPLKVAGFIGAATVLLGAILMTIGIAPLVVGGSIEGMTLLAGWLTLLVGTLMIGQGVLGEYVGRLSEQSKGRPLFLIDSVIRFDVPADEDEPARAQQWHEPVRSSEPPFPDGRRSRPAPAPIDC